MNKRKHTIKYLVIDFIAAILAWYFFNLYRKAIVETQFYGHEVKLTLDLTFIIILIAIGFYWIIIYVFSGYYHRIYRKSRLQEFSKTLVSSAIGIILIFFGILLDDVVNDYTDYYYSFIILFSLHFGFTFIPRTVLTSLTIRNIRKGVIGFNTIVIGSNGKAIEIINSFSGKNHKAGYRILGFVNVYKSINPQLEKLTKNLGNFENVDKIIVENKIEEVIIAIESNEHSEIEKIIAQLQKSSADIKIIPDLFEILIGKTELSFIEGTPLLHVTSELLPIWAKNFKWSFDIFVSVLFLVVFSPLYLIAAIGVKLSSPGPLIYRQTRVGLHGKEFTIFKFRSMVNNAEKNGPELSSVADSRVTRFGQIMRRTRLDEIPQFINVLKGDMSVIGPRPERKFYIDQIVEKAPEFMLLLKIKPGITSLGQVKFGYAENIDQMLERLKYDIIYIKNMSLYLDFKILIFTILTIIKRNGK
ncbi:MAG: sugar transferase [Bacteroidales bacterium]